MPTVISSALDRIIRVGCLLVLTFAALTHGVVEPWSVLIFQLLITALFCLWAFKVYRERKLDARIPVLVWPLFGLVMIGALQSITWIDAEGVRRSLSYDVEATRSTMLVLVFLLVWMLLAANFFASREELLWLAKFLPWYGLVLAVQALLQQFSAPHTILWLREIKTAQPFGTFINRDHFAGYMELLIGMPVALLATRYVRGEGRFLYVVAAMFMGLALVLTLSRGGVLSLVLELLLIGALAIRRTSYMQRGAGKKLNFSGAWVRRSAAILKPSTRVEAPPWGSACKKCWSWMVGAGSR